MQDSAPSPIQKKIVAEDLGWGPLLSFSDTPRWPPKSSCMGRMIEGKTKRTSICTFFWRIVRWLESNPLFSPSPTPPSAFEVPMFCFGIGCYSQLNTAGSPSATPTILCNAVQQWGNPILAWLCTLAIRKTGGWFKREGFLSAKGAWGYSWPIGIRKCAGHWNFHV